VTELRQELARASAMLDVRRYAEASALLARIVSAEPDSGRAWCLMARAHLGADRYRDAIDANKDLQKQMQDELDKRCGKSEGCQLAEGDKLVRDAVAAGKLPKVSWEKIIEHIDHAVKLVGADHVGLGSDFDGANMPYGMESAADLPKITDALVKKGYSDADIRKILGENTLRVMEQVEAVSRRMMTEPEHEMAGSKKK